MYPNVQLHIAGQWRNAEGDRTIPVLNPATEEQIGTRRACSRGRSRSRRWRRRRKGFASWRKISAFERSKIMRKAAELLRERADAIAHLMTMEQGKPLAERRGESLSAPT